MISSHVQSISLKDSARISPRLAVTFIVVSSIAKKMSQQLWLRCEKKEFERRSALTPTTAKRLIDAGFEITVERDEQRIFKDSEFEAYALDR